jgi:hypothetical protein
MVGEDEHLSGLRDAIEGMLDEWEDLLVADEQDETLVDVIERHIRAWLSHIGEGEIEAAARVLTAAEGLTWERIEAADFQRYWCNLAKSALAASRGVLLPKEES